MDAPVPPRAVKQILRRNLQGKCVSAPPRTRSAPASQSKSQFLGQFLLGGLDLEVGPIFRRSLRATTKKVVNFFGKKKCTPDKILATPMLHALFIVSSIYCMSDSLVKTVTDENINFTGKSN